MYHVYFKDQDGTYHYDEYNLKISIFTGDLDLKFYKDANGKNEL